MREQEKTADKKLEQLRQFAPRGSATVGVIGLGYVGMQLAAAMARGGFETVGLEIDPAKIALLNKGKSYINAVRRISLTIMPFQPIPRHLGIRRTFDLSCHHRLCADAADVVIATQTSPMWRTRRGRSPTT